MVVNTSREDKTMAKTRLLQTEKEHHKQAFEVYYALGLKRTYQAVADKFGVSTSTIKNWSRSFGWRKRIADRDATMTRQTIDQVCRQGVEENERYLRIVQTALMRSVRDIAEGKVKVRMQDLEKLILFDERLRRGANSTVDHRGQPVPGRVVIYLPENGRRRPSRTPGQDERKRIREVKTPDGEDETPSN
jgi:transposase